MIEKEINIAIAKACGIHGPWLEKVTACGCDGQWDWFNAAGKRLPDYCHDLNAMHEAEQILNDYEKTQMVASVGEIRKKCGFVFHATARERAEAFLRTVGKWKE